MLIGYARVSTADQKLDMQRDDLKRVGCRRSFTDVASGGKDRPGRAEAIAYARKGDTIVVWKLDRFGRSLVDLVQTVAQLRERGVGFRSLHESIDTTTSGGRLIFHVFSALAEFERDLIRERTMAGLAAARARGRLGGRPALLDIEQRALLHTLAKDRNNSPHVHLCHPRHLTHQLLPLPRQTGASRFDVQAGAGGAAEEVRDGARASALAATEATCGQTVAADPVQRGDVAGDQDHELAIGALATAAIVAQVIAAAGAEATPTREADASQGGGGGSEVGRS